MKFSIESILGIAFVSLWVLGYLAEAFLKGREKAKKGSEPEASRAQRRSEPPAPMPTRSAPPRPAPPTLRPPPTARPAPVETPPPRTARPAPPRVEDAPEEFRRPGPPTRARKPAESKPQQQRSRRPATQAKTRQQPKPAVVGTETDDWDTWERPRTAQLARGPSAPTTAPLRPVSNLAVVLGLPVSEREALRSAILAREILSPPLALREPLDL